MARAYWLVLLTPIMVAVGLTPRAVAEPAPQPRIRLGVLKGMFRDTPPAIIQAVADPFRALFKKQTGLDGDVEVVADCETLARTMKDKKVDIGVFHGFEYAWVRGRYPELMPIVAARPAIKPQACIVVHVASGIEGPEGLKGACVAVPSGTKAHCDLYIDHLQTGLEAGVCCPLKQTEWWPEDALNAVAAERAKAALVDAAALVAYEKNQPGQFKQLKVLCKSEPLPATVVVTRKDALDPKVIGSIRSGLVNANKTSEGRAFLFLWKLEGFDTITPAYEKLLEQTAKTYPEPEPK